MRREEAPTREAILECVDNDVELLRALAEAWLGQVDTLLALARDGVADGDPTAVMRAAHTIKGAAGVFAADAAVASAARLEAETRDGRMPPDVEELLERVRSSAGALSARLREIVDGT